MIIGEAVLPFVPPPRAQIWPATFVNTRFFEEQIFVHRDPFCLAQIPAMVSNGSHCDPAGNTHDDARHTRLGRATLRCPRERRSLAIPVHTLV